MIATNDFMFLLIVQSFYLLSLWEYIRLIRFRKAVRFHGKKTDSVVVPEITMISQESQQGV